METSITGRTQLSTGTWHVDPAHSVSHRVTLRLDIEAVKQI
jgi:hypothetical protein